MHHLLDIKIGKRDREVLSARLWALGVVGVEDMGDRLRAAFTDRPAAVAASDALGLPQLIEDVEDHAGLDAWREYAGWVQAGPFVICPPWIDPPDDSPVIFIDPGHAFGSGSHPSTRMATAVLAEVIEPGMSVLDVGCGSGVLSIAAARLGADVVGVDIDPGAIEATNSNASINRCSEQVSASLGTAADIGGTFDVVVVNVTIDIHETIAGDVADRMTPHGILIASGLLAGSHEERLANIFAHLRLIGRWSEAEWATVMLKREGQRQ